MGPSRTREITFGVRVSWPPPNTSAQRPKNKAPHDTAAHACTRGGRAARRGGDSGGDGGGGDGGSAPDAQEEEVAGTCGEGRGEREGAPGGGFASRPHTGVEQVGSAARRERSRARRPARDRRHSGPAESSNRDAPGEPILAPQLQVEGIEPLGKANLQAQRSRAQYAGHERGMQGGVEGIWHLSHEHGACLGVPDGYGAKGIRPGLLHTHQEGLQVAHRHSR